MTDDPLHIERRGGVLEVTLDRPKANAIDAATSRLMGDVFADFRDDPDLRVAIVTAAGERFFSAGWDLKAAANGEPPDTDYGVGGFAGLQELPDLNKPVIAAVNGMAVGGGLELAISCDLVFAAEHARFALPEIKVGVLPDAASIKLHRRMPFHVTMELLLTGRWMEAEEAARWGLVNEVLPADRLMDRAREIAGLLADGPPARLRRHQGDHSHDRDPQGAGGFRLDARQRHSRGQYALCQRGPAGGYPRLRRKARTGLERPLMGSDLLSDPDQKKMVIVRGSRDWSSTTLRLAMR